MATPYERIGNPAGNGYVLASTIKGVRYWVSPTDMIIEGLPAPPDAENEYVLATKNGAFYWVPSVAPAPAPEVTFGGESVTFGGEVVEW